MNSLYKLIAVYVITIGTFYNYSIAQNLSELNYDMDLILKNKIKSIHTIYNDSVLQSYHYDTSGLFIYETGKSVIGLKYEIFYKYNNEKQLIEKKTISETIRPNKKYTETEVYKYDKFGNLIRDGMRFNDKGQLIETNDFYGELGYKKFVYEYENDLIIRVQQVDDTLWYTEYQYNDNETLKYRKENSYVGAPDVEYYRTQEIDYIYNSENQLIIKRIKTYTSIYGENNKECFFYYYDAGLLIKEVRKTGNSITTEYNYVYEYY